MHWLGARFSPKRLLQACLLLLAVGCIPTPDGCNALDSDDECEWGESRCRSGRREICQDSPCGNYWYEEDCPTEKAFCVTVDDSRIECASSPHCASTEACLDFGLCADGPAGCVPDAEGCAQSTSCGASGLCGFDGTGCAPTREGCAQSTDECQVRGRCGYSGSACVPTVEGCEGSSNCRERGECNYTARTCACWDVECTTWGVCEEPGGCEYPYDCSYCGIDDAACESSENCATSGFCRAVDGLCVAAE